MFAPNIFPLNTIWPIWLVLFRWGGGGEDFLVFIFFPQPANLLTEMLYFAFKSFVFLYSLSGIAWAISYFLSNVEEQCEKVEGFSPSNPEDRW